MGLHVKLDMQYNALLRVECVRVSYDNLERRIRGGNAHNAGTLWEHSMSTAVSSVRVQPPHTYYS